LALGVGVVAAARSPTVRTWGLFSLGCYALSAAFLSFSARRYRRFVRQLDNRPLS
jgi:hypothetical protein